MNPCHTPNNINHNCGKLYIGKTKQILQQQIHRANNTNKTVNKTNLPRWHMAVPSSRRPSPFRNILDAGFPALLLPQQIVVRKKPPAAASLRRSQEVLRLEEREDRKREFARQEWYKVPLKLRLDHLHHVSHLRRLAASY